jgi:hypothetical protein
VHLAAVNAEAEERVAGRIQTLPSESNDPEVAELAQQGASALRDIKKLVGRLAWTVPENMRGAHVEPVSNERNQIGPSRSDG